MAEVGVLGLIGGLFGAAGSLVGGMSQMNALNYQSQVAANNAKIASTYAGETIEAGQLQAAAVSMQGRAQYATLKTTQAAGGVNVDAGSNAMVQASQRELGALSPKVVMANAQLQEYGYQVQGEQATAQSQLYSYEAPQAMFGASLGAAGQAFGGAAKWYTPTTPTAPTSTSISSMPSLVS